MNTSRSPVRLIAVSAFALICLLLILQIKLSQNVYDRCVMEQQQTQEEFEGLFLRDTVERGLRSLEEVRGDETRLHEQQFALLSSLTDPDEIRQVLATPEFSDLHFALYAAGGELSAVDARVAEGYLPAHEALPAFVETLPQHRLLTFSEEGGQLLLWVDEAQRSEEIRSRFLGELALAPLESADRSLWADEMVMEGNKVIALRRRLSPQDPGQEGQLLDARALAALGMDDQVIETLLTQGAVSYRVPDPAGAYEEQVVYAAYDAQSGLVVQAACRLGVVEQATAQRLASLRSQMHRHMLVAGIAALLCYAMLLLVLAFSGRRARRQQEEFERRITEKELELSMATNKVEKVYEGLMGAGVLDRNVMHNHASLSNFLDANFPLFTRKSSEAILSGQMSTALVLVEPDQMAELTQQYGLEAADTVLSSLVTLLEQHTRKNDIVARWHEDMFLLVLHDITLKNALGRVEELRATAERMEVFWEGQPMRVTVTCGLSMMLDVDKGWKQSLSRAQRALGRAREASRNTVCHEIFQ